MGRSGESNHQMKPWLHRLNMTQLTKSITEGWGWYRPRNVNNKRISWGGPQLQTVTERRAGTWRRKTHGFSPRPLKTWILDQFVLLIDMCLCFSAITLNQDQARPPLETQTFWRNSPASDSNCCFTLQLAHKSRTEESVGLTWLERHLFLVWCSKTKWQKVK